MARLSRLSSELHGAPLDAATSDTEGGAGLPWGPPGRPSPELLVAVVEAARELVGASRASAQGEAPRAAWAGLQAGLSRPPWSDTSLGRLTAELALRPQELVLLTVLLAASMDGEVARVVAPGQPERETLGLRGDLA